MGTISAHRWAGARLLPVMTSHARHLLFGCLAASAFACTGTAEPPRARPSPPPAAASPEAALARAGGVAASHDERGRPRFVWAVAEKAVPAGASVEQAARAHIARFAPAYGADGTLASSLELVRVHDMGTRGKIAMFRQRVDGREVLGSSVKVLMRANLELVALVGTPSVEAAHAAAAKRSFRFAARPASVPADARPVLVGSALTPAYEFERVSASEGWHYVVAADDGRVLARDDLRRDASFDYRVWADPVDHRPADGPYQDLTPHPTGVPDRRPLLPTPPSLVSVDSLASTGDPWLAAGASETTGNNADAFINLDYVEGFDVGDVRGDVTAAGVFDRIYDVLLAPLASLTQQKAALTQAFYVVNWMHDWYYDSGFDERAGNAQLSNFGRGGLEGDPVLIETQWAAGEGRRDYNFIYMTWDGRPPRMHFTVDRGGDRHRLSVPALARDLVNQGARFGPAEYELTGELAAVTGLCTAPVAGALTGKIAFPTVAAPCEPARQVKNAQDAGALATLLVAATPSGPLLLLDRHNVDGITTPAQSIGGSDGNSVRAALASGPVSVTMERKLDVERDGALDSMLVAHEWAHHMYYRLTGCEGGGNPQCNAMMEGWADFMAVHMVLRAGDDPYGSYALAPYLAADSSAYVDPAYFGIRRFPSSASFARNPLTFAHLSNGVPVPTSAPMQDWGNNNWETHSAGEVWSAMLFEAYAALLADPARSFEASRRLMSDYVVAGLELTPAGATFTEGRDAILAAVAAADAHDLDVVAHAFARRGFGSCAKPPRTKGDYGFGHVVEDFSVKPWLSLADIVLVEDAARCEPDGVLDGGETGALRLTVRNAGPVKMVGATITLTSSLPGVTFPHGAQVIVPDVAPFASVTMVLPVAVDDTVATGASLTLGIDAAHPDSCDPLVQTRLLARLNHDEAPAVSTRDDVETVATVWNPTGDGAAAVFNRIANPDGNRVWHAVDRPFSSDTALESPDLHVGTSAPFVIHFAQRYLLDTEFGSPLTFLDGGLIELSTDAGMTWQDVSIWADAGYDGEIVTDYGSPIGGRRAYGGRSASYPAAHQMNIDLGTALAGQTVRVRFRLVADESNDSPFPLFGWDLDDLAFDGLDGTPFPGFVPNACTEMPAADAGVDATPDATPDAAPDAAPVPTPDAAPAPSPDAAPAPMPDAATTPPPPPDRDHGCSIGVARADAPAPWLAALLLLAAGALRRVRRRPRRA